MRPLLAILFLVLSGRVLGDEMDVPKIAQTAKPAVLTIFTNDAQGNVLGTGTGFFVSPDGAIVTNFHVIEKGVQFKAQTETGAFYSVGAILAEDREKDVAILKADASNVPFISLSTRQPEVGESIVIVGSPKRWEGTVSTGIVSAVRGDGATRVLQVTAPVSRGSSGSPVLDANGSALGIATWIDPRGQNLNFAIPASIASDLLEKARAGTIEPKTPSSPGQISTQDYAAYTDADYVESVALSKSPSEATRRLELLLKVAQRFPDAGNVNFALGNVYFELGMDGDAIESYKRAFLATPSDYVVLGDLSIALKKANRLEEAKAAAERAIKLSPTDPWIWAVRGDCLLAAGDFAGADADWNRALELKPDAEIASKIWRARSSEYLALGRYKEAKEAGQTAEAWHETALLKERKDAQPPTASNTPDAPAQAPLYAVTGIKAGDSLSVRTGPGMNYAVTSKLPNNFGGIRIIGKPVMNGKTDWVHVQFDGGEGWVRGKYLR